MSSPRGLFAGGIGAMGTDELRFAGRASGDGERRLPSAVGDAARDEGVGDGGVRGKSFAKSSAKGSFERSGGWRTLRYMFRFRSARFACGTYLENECEVRLRACVLSKRRGGYSLICVANLLGVHPAQEEKRECRD